VPEDEAADTVPDVEEPDVGVDESADPVQRLVAILIMVVTLAGAGVAYLQIQAGDREGVANRRAEEYSVRTLTSLVAAGSASARREAATDVATDLLDQSIYLGATAGQGGPAAAYAAKLAAAFKDVSTSVSGEAKDVVGYDLAATDFGRFYVEQYVPTYEAIEYQKAFARERDAWGSKGGRYVTVITVFAVALFLLGLTLTVPSVARPLFLVMGVVVAMAAAAWGATIWLQGVEGPPASAIQAYAAGQAKLDVVTFDPTADKADHDEIVADMTKAIQARPDFREAYLARGSAYFNYDLAVRPGGPQGSAEAKADWEKAVELDPADFTGWVDLGAVQFWLGEYRAAVESTRRAIAIRNDEPVSNLNYALVFGVTHDDAGYRKQMVRVREILGGIPSWLRNAVVARYGIVVDKALRYRPDLTPIMTRLREDLLRTVHEIEVSGAVNGTPTPPAVEARAETPTFTLDATRTTLQVSFRYTGIKVDEPWLYRTYVNGFRNDNFSIASQPFDGTRFDVPDGGITLTFTDRNGFVAGQVIRVEVFVEGNLLASGEFTVP
jgi:tetratricopeptide (TPR) repeat protein